MATVIVNGKFSILQIREKDLVFIDLKGGGGWEVTVLREGKEIKFTSEEKKDKYDIEKEGIIIEDHPCG